MNPRVHPSWRTECTSTVDTNARKRLESQHFARGFSCTHQADEDAEQLYDVGVGHAVETAEERVEHCDARAQHHARPVVHVNDHAQGRTCNQQNIHVEMKSWIICSKRRI